MEHTILYVIIDKNFDCVLADKDTHNWFTWSSFQEAYIVSSEWNGIVVPAFEAIKILKNKNGKRNKLN